MRAISEILPQPDDLSAPSGDHLIELDGGDWTVWRSAALRGAGFPAAIARSLSSEPAAAAADAYEARVSEADAAKAVALDTLSELGRNADRAIRAGLRAIRRRLKHGVVRGTSPTAVEVVYAQARASECQAAAALARAHADGIGQELEQLRRIVEDARFHEAAVWQNRRAYTTARATLFDRRASPSQIRAAADFFARLVQRYCVKNDSVGFFGPVGWAALTDQQRECHCRPGRELTSSRRVYFEGWAIDALAKRLNDTCGVQPWIAIRVAAGVWLDDASAYAPYRGRVPLDPDEYRLLRLCADGRTAAAVVAEYVAACADRRAAEASAFDTIRKLVRLGLVHWKLEVAPQLHPERELARKIARIGEPGPRAACRASLRALLSARRRVADAAGDAVALAQAMADLEDVFTHTTGAAAVRRSGQMYAGRGLVYEDCRRACDVTIGGRCLARLGPPLSVFLDGARWASAQWRAEFDEHLRRCHAELRARHGSAAIDAHLFVNYVVAAGGGMSGTHERHRILDDVVARVKTRVQDVWRSVLPPTDGASRVGVDVAAIRPAAADAFRTHESGTWCGYVSPDVLISAGDADAFERGDCTFVLGEVHSGNTLLWSALAAQYPDQRELIRYLTDDTAGTDVIVMHVPKAIWTSRLNTLVSPSFWRYEHGHDMPGVPACRPLPAACLVTVDGGSGVVARARDGRLECDAYDLFAPMLYREISEIMSECLPPARHSPRITIGDLTIARETWRVTRSELPFLQQRDESTRFARLRAWARGLGLPRWVFYKCPHERKPCYLDLASVLYCNQFVKMIERMHDDEGQIRVSEMLPTFAGAWLPDHEGRRYTSELRIVARCRRDAGSPASAGR
jgi:hypothetical protein